VVARVAFWTDDETAKVNINTASEGTYWDTPVANSQPGIDADLAASNYNSNNDAVFEWDLADRQGAQKEYQRYPGHPATTCLSTIFGRQLLNKVGAGVNKRALMAEEIFKLVPRVTGAEYSASDLLYNSGSVRDFSSKAGTVRAGGGGTTGDLSVNVVTPDADRLYATIDEFLYNPNFGTSARNPWLLAPAAPPRDTTREMLEMGKFFLTANSKAPEQNLFNLPRISIWPEQVAEARRTAFDKLIAFCSTVGPKTDTTKSLPFYFTRQNGDSSTADLSPRNMALMNYLVGLTGRSVPGWDTTGAAAKTFAAKYANGDRAQILTEIFDYIRCTNLADRSDPAVQSSYTQSLATGPSTYFKSNPALGQSTLGQVVPIEMSLDGYNTRGMGRILTISELALVMISRNPGLPSPIKLQAVLIPKYFSPMAGFCTLANNVRLTFEDINITVNGKAVFKDFSKSTYSQQPTIYDVGRVGRPRSSESKVGGTLGWNMLFEPIDGQNPMASPANSVLPNAELEVGSDPNALLTIGGTVTVKISGPAQDTPTNSTNEPVIQTFKFKFPDQQVPIPLPSSVAPYRYFTRLGDGTGSNIKEPNATSRHGAGQNRGCVYDEDTIRSLAAVGNPSGGPYGVQGDLRLVAASKLIADNYFAPY
ncbi:MAG: hypothetical protein WCH40_12480, partial [Verrucomicrobiales bacterium]